MPALSDEAPLNAGGPFVQRVRLWELLVDYQLPVRSCYPQHVWGLAGARVDLVLEPLRAALQDRSHVEGIGRMARDG